MRNKHIFKGRVDVRCTKDSCGYKFAKIMTVEYITNQRGDVIEHRIRS